MKTYSLRIAVPGKNAHVKRIAKIIAENNQIVLLCHANIIHYAFQRSNNLEAAEYSRDIMNQIIDAGGQVVQAYLQCTCFNQDPHKRYVSDWEFHLNKGFNGDEELDKLDPEDVERRLYLLDLKTEQER